MSDPVRVLNGASIVLGAYNSVQLSELYTTLSNVNIKALPTTPITLVPMAGLGLLIVPVDVLLFFKSGSTAYSNIDPNASMGVQYATTNTHIGGIIANSSRIDAVGALTAFLASTGGLMQRLTFPFLDNRGAPQGLGLSGDSIGSDANTNCDLQLYINNQSAGALTGGNAANALMVLTTYRVVSVP